MPPKKRFVSVVDDDPAVRDSLELLLETSGYETHAYGSAKAFLDSEPLNGDGCVIVDIRMPDMDGLQLQEEMKNRGSKLPIIVMTGHGDVPLAVRAIKAGASDFLEKPCDPAILLESIGRVWNRSEISGAELPKEVQEKLETLTHREKEVLDRIVAGKLNKVIAYELSISPRTVEIHRARLMQKLGARNLAELMRMLLVKGERPA